MTDIVLVRHGQTTWHTGNRYAGRTDVPLDERGVAQARQLAQWARTAGLAAVWSSDLSRARLTAQPCAEAIGLPLLIEPRLREVDFGRGEGQTREDMEQTMPEALAAFEQDPVAHHFPDGEDPRAATARGIAGLWDIAAAHPGRRVLVVGHGTLIRLMLCSLLGLALGDYRRLLPVVRNGCLHELQLRDGQVAVLSWNAPPVESDDKGS